MESLLGRDRITFEVLRARLVQQVKLRIDNGEFTERGLSRILGISQSQTHNVLKGARRLQIELAERILAKLNISVMDLLTADELHAALGLKMTKWDSEIMADTEATEFDLTWLLPPKKKPAHSEMEIDRNERKAG